MRGGSGLRVGVLGGGFAGQAHVEAIRRSGLAREITLASRGGADSPLADSVVDDYRRVLDDETVDVVHNCLPNALHAEVNAAALEAGKHVVSEKPLAISEAEAFELEQLAARAGVVNAVCFNYRFYPLVREARERIARGALGRPILAHGVYLQDWLLRQEDYNWRVDADDGGRSRAVADIGSHWADLVSHLLDEPIVEVRATLGRVHDQRLRPHAATPSFSTSSAHSTQVDVETEDWATLLLRLGGGALAHALVSQVSAGSKNALRIQVDGTEAALRWEQERAEELWIGRRGAPNEVVVKDLEALAPEAAALAALPAGHAEGWAAALQQLVAAVYRTILDGADRDFPTFADGAAAVRVVEAALASDESDQWESVREGATEREPQR